MCTKLKSITFIFENCDEITIDGKYVGDFLVDDIRTRIKRIAINSIKEIEVADTFAIEIHKNANVERYEHNLTSQENLKQMTFDRFMRSDIVRIKFDLIESCFEEWQIPCVHHYSYYVNDCVFENSIQDNYISKDGHLYIAISKNRSIKDFFDINTINNSVCMNIYWDLYKIGNN